MRMYMYSRQVFRERVVNLTQKGDDGVPSHTHYIHQHKHTQTQKPELTSGIPVFSNFVKLKLQHPVESRPIHVMIC